MGRQQLPDLLIMTNDLRSARALADSHTIVSAAEYTKALLQVALAEYDRRSSESTDKPPKADDSGHAPRKGK